MIVLFIKDQGTGLAPELKDKLGTPSLLLRKKALVWGLLSAIVPLPIIISSYGSFG